MKCLRQLCVAVVAAASTAATPALAETAVETVVRSGNLGVVVFGDDLPFIRKNGDSYEGLAMDVADAVRQELEAFAGKPISVVPVPVSSVEAAKEALISGDAEMACGVAFTWERSLLVDYTLPFALGGVRLLAPAGIDGTPGSLAGKKVGVVRDSYSAQVLKQGAPDAIYMTYSSPSEALAALRTGAVPILGGDSLWLKANQADNAPSAGLVPLVPYGRAAIGCIIPENNSTLMNYSNIGIGKMLQGYVNDDAIVRERVNRWLGPGSALNLSPDLIEAFYATVLSTAAQIAIP